MSLEAETRRAAAYQALGFLRALIAGDYALPPGMLAQASRIIDQADKEPE